MPDFEKKLKEAPAGTADRETQDLAILEKTVAFARRHSNDELTTTIENLDKKDREKFFLSLINILDKLEPDVQRDHEWTGLTDQVLQALDEMSVRECKIEWGDSANDPRYRGWLDQSNCRYEHVKDVSVENEILRVEQRCFKKMGAYIQRAIVIMGTTR